MEVLDSDVNEKYTLNHSPSLSADELQGLGVASSDPFGLTERPILALILLFLAGLTLALTPCVLPMLPIVANIVAEQENPSTRRSFMLSSAYGLGVATAYGLLGALIAYAGESLGLLGLLQNPIILIGFAVVFVFLGLYMLEIIKIRLPTSLSQKLHNISQSGNNKLGSIGGSFLVGLLSALVVSPCVSAPLSGALFAVSSIGNIPLGFAALFMLGLGLSTPLVLFATTEGKLLPQAGEWMNWVKHGFAYLMFAVALIMLERVYQHPIMLVLWAGWFGVIGWWAWKFSTHLKKLPSLIAKLVSVLAIAWAGYLLVGAYFGGTNSLNPMQNLKHKKVAQTSNSGKEFKKPITVNTLAQLDELLSKHSDAVVDVRADWCIECRIMEKEIFEQPPESLKGWQVIKVDITETNDESKAVLKRYEMVGPPTLLYYSKGQLLTKQVGQVERTDFDNLVKVLNEKNSVE